MKIAFVGESLDYGGAQKMLSFVIKSVANMADEVIIFLENIEDIDYDLPKNIRLVKLSYKERKKKFNALEKIFRLHSYSKQINKILKDNDVSIICGFGAYFAFIAVIATKKIKTKVIGCERRSPQSVNKIWRILSKYTYSKCDIASFQLKGARDYYKNIDEDKVSIIPNPFISTSDVERVEIQNRKKKITMAAARYEWEKGFDVGIKSMKYIEKKHPEYVLEIYGDGDANKMYSDVLECVRDKSKIVFKGLSTQIIADINDSSVFLLPSRSEGIPNMLLEVMGAGIPCVAADCPPGGPRMLLKNNTRGILVEMDNPKKTADAICELIENKELADTLSKNAMQVKDEFSVMRIQNEWRSLFQSVIK
ncbi:glycosyltransferase [Eubacterium limosum]|uniref:glycosyltransferase n=1 Tax=Eubacterium limosum TaxID=1736 RepID=UPI0022E37AF9|nr:glycosyltransferase [Eubacterium limosum]